MAGTMLKALVEEMGVAGYEQLMDGSKDNSSSVTNADPTIIQLYLAEAKKKLPEQEGDGKESDSDTEDDDL